MGSAIEWTEETWNPVTGCNKVSPGCKYCYAETMHKRLNAMGANGYERPFTEVAIQPARLNAPGKRKKPTMYFVNSMSDLFHPDVPLVHIDKVMQAMRDTPQHTYQVLTKRSESLPGYFWRRGMAPKNLWLGVSVEDKKYGLPRIDDLRLASAYVRFLSIEPLLEDLGELDFTGIHWVIVGGESGPRARPMNIDWVRDIRDQCIDQGVSFFFKQWGAYGADGVKRNKKANGRTLDGRAWDEMPLKLMDAARIKIGVMA